MILGLILDSQCIPRVIATFSNALFSLFYEADVSAISDPPFNFLLFQALRMHLASPGSKLMNSGDINIQPKVYSNNYRKRSPFLPAINGKILLVLQDFLAAEVLFLNVFRSVVVSRLLSLPLILLAVNQKASIINIGRVPSGMKKAPLTYLAIQISRHAAFTWQGLQGSIINSICFQKWKEKGSSWPSQTNTSSSCDQSWGNIQNYELLTACS
ncbi:hypothetical protein SADUNF_Sadunf11G0109600 [Salix dunnii]|uniref:Uncharacterized protein n=1 Tax=Salix dunnii TaxID=1413687 RepID=A0A835JU75_9ROSI|nr:hypothetical protein SADUNF_Sadunf11G0109600 [Salix dunnii]